MMNLKKLTLILTLSVLCCSRLYAQNNYPAESIPPKLRANADAIIRENNYSVEMKNSKNIKLSYHYVITLLKPSAAKDGTLGILYNTNISIKHLSGAIYDEYGHLIRKISARDFKDESAVSSSALYEDDRIKFFKPTIINYPVTIAYDYELKLTNSLIIPSWEPCDQKAAALESSRFTFECAPDDSIRIQQTGISTPPLIAVSADTKKLEWSITEVSAEKEEPQAPPQDDNRMSVTVLPVNFSYYDKKGAYQNWDELGQWVFNNLIQPQQDYTPQMQHVVRELSEKYPDKKMLARALYQYMQQRMRYVSIQIGIGGYQPTRASLVDQLGYGDCKGLVNYLQTLLNLAGINSLFCIINAGNDESDMDTSYTRMNVGNHAILAVPFANDTMWLECTSNKMPAGFLGDFTDNRHAWALTSGWSKIIHTPTYHKEQNKRLYKTELWIDSSGNATGTLAAVYEGIPFENHQFLDNLSGQELTKQLTQLYNIDNIGIAGFTSQYGQQVPRYEESMKIAIPGWAAQDHQILYFYPNIWHKASLATPSRNRKKPLFIRRDFTNTDTVMLHFPPNFKVATAFRDIHLKDTFGTYDIYFLQQPDHCFMMIRQLSFYGGTYPAAAYARMSSFLEDIFAADRQKIGGRLQ